MLCTYTVLPTYQFDQLDTLYAEILDGTRIVNEKLDFFKTSRWKMDFFKIKWIKAWGFDDFHVQILEICWFYGAYVDGDFIAKVSGSEHSEIDF